MNILTTLAQLLTQLVISLALSGPMLLLWNHGLVGAIDGIHMISWSQAWAITTLMQVIKSLK